MIAPSDGLLAIFTFSGTIADMIENLNWASSRLRKSIPLYQSNAKPKHPIILIGGVHGDEPEGVALAEATLKWLKSYENPEALTPWIVVPCLNPDGYSKNERTNGNGVDLNRNYPSKDWSPEIAKPRYNPGPSPSSEPEIQAMVQLIKNTKPRLLIHCHSWHPCIIYTGDSARSDAEALGRSSGYKISNDIGYPTPGSLSRFGWHDHKIPVICIEEAEHTPLEQVWPHFAEGIKEIFTSPAPRGLK